MSNESLHFLKGREEIMQALTDSKNNGTVLALTIPAIPPGFFTTAVDDIFPKDNEMYVSLKRHDVTGFLFEQNVLPVGEIVSVCSLQSKWQTLAEQAAAER